MNQLISTIQAIDAGQIFSAGAIVTILGIGAWALVKFTQGLCDIYNNFADARAKERENG